MKRQILILLLILLNSTLPTFAQSVPTYIPTDGLRAWYPFNGNANDESGNGNNGSVKGATLSNDRFGKASTSYYFDGSAEIDCGTDASLNLDECTISAWVYYQPNTEPAQTIIAKYDADKLGSYALAIFGNQADVWFSLKGDKYVDVLSLDTLASNQWYNITATHSVASGTKLYINGVLNASDPTSFNVLQAPNDVFRIGSQGNFFPLRLDNGKIDDIGVWGRALSQIEITALYSGASLGFDDIDNESSLNIFPNPITRSILLESKNIQLQNSSLIISDMLGNKIYEQSVNTQSVSVDLASQAPGVYCLQLTTSDHNVVRKLFLFK